MRTYLSYKLLLFQQFRDKQHILDKQKQDMMTDGYNKADCYCKEDISTYFFFVFLKNTNVGV
jgi:hypothetical protein